MTSPGSLARQTTWLLLERGFSILLGLIGFVLISRELGPESLGRFGLAMGAATALSMIATLGLETHLTSQLTLRKQDSSRLIGAGLMLQSITLVVLIALMMALLHWSGRSDLRAPLMLAAAVAVMNSAWVWECQLLARQRLLALCGQRLACSVALIAAIGMLAAGEGASESMFMMAFLGQATLRLLLAMVLSGGTRMVWHQDSCRDAGSLLPAAKTLALGIAAVAAYSQLDRFALVALAGEYQAGLYLAAARLSEGLQFIPLTIANAYVPRLAELSRSDPEAERRLLRQLFDVSTALAYIAALSLCLTAPWLIPWLYGSSYAETVTVLQLHVWSNLMVFLGVISGRWMMVHGWHHLYFLRSLLGIAVHLAALFSLVPALGAIGAAASAIAAQIAVVLVFDALYPETRPALHHKWRALITPQLPRALIDRR